MLIIVAGLMIGGYGIFSLVTTLTRPSGEASVLAKAAARAKPIPSSLQKTLGAIIAVNPDTQIGIALENMTTGETQTYGVNAPFEAASTAKLITAAAYYHLVETGQASLTAAMGGYNAGFQIKEMINQSDNDSWSMLVSAIGDNELQAYAQSIGLDYQVNGNTLSPASMTNLLTKLYGGKLLNKTDTDQLLSYMQNTNDDTLIPAALNSNITVYHKYGLLNGELHDAAILTDGNQSYALVIYTKGADDSDDPQRTTMIHQITQDVTGAIFNS